MERHWAFPSGRPYLPQWVQKRCVQSFPRQLETLDGFALFDVVLSYQWNLLFGLLRGRCPEATAGRGADRGRLGAGGLARHCCYW